VTISMLRFKRLQYVARMMACALVGSSIAACSSMQSASTLEATRSVSEARIVLLNFMRDPNQAWIQQNLSRARGVLIAPQIVRAGFIVGGSGGRAVLVTRDGRTWTGPAFYDLVTASVGFQAGVDVSEAVILVMTEKGLNSLLSTSFKIGGDASIAAGPVGSGARSTVTADLVAFTRAKGLYGGVNLDGTLVIMNVAWNDAFYGGTNLLPPDILIRKTVTNQESVPLLSDLAAATR
jgi:SH3 domain-containing YSC84-like protein 1